MGSSIRMKFFMFLVVLAGTSVLTMDFLKSYSLGVIVLMPVLFLVVVPFASSKMAKGISRASLGRRDRPDEDSSLAEIADEIIDTDTSTDMKPYYEPDTELEPSDVEEPQILEETEPEEDISKVKPSRGLKKSELIKLLPEDVKESIGLDELKKLSKDALEALLDLEEMGSKSKDVD
jgi:hypothetical protein